MLTGTAEPCQRVPYCVANRTVLTFGTAARVEASDESADWTLNVMSGDEDLFALKAIDSLKASLAMLIAVSPSTPKAIPSTARIVRRRRRVTSAIDLRVSAPPGNDNLIATPPLL